jgi:hypothetical protein
VLKDLREVKEHKVVRDLRVGRVHKESKALRALKERRAHKVLQVILLLSIAISLTTQLGAHLLTDILIGNCLEQSNTTPHTSEFLILLKMTSTWISSLRCWLLHSLL